MKAADGNLVTILLVEDNDVDAEAIQRAFRKHRVMNPVVVVGDGQQALDYLRGRDAADGQAPPCLILLDLNLPRMDGPEFLVHLRKDPALASNAVFVLSSSDLDRDKTAANLHCIAGYIVKSKVQDGFDEMIDMLRNYCRVNVRPSR